MATDGGCALGAAVGIAEEVRETSDDGVAASGVLRSIQGTNVHGEMLGTRHSDGSGRYVAADRIKRTDSRSIDYQFAPSSGFGLETSDRDRSGDAAWRSYGGVLSCVRCTAIECRPAVQRYSDWALIMIIDAFASSAPVADDESVALTKSFRRSRPSSVALPMSRSPNGIGA